MTRTSGIAFLLAALIWFTVLPLLLHQDVFHTITATYVLMMHAGAVLLSVLAVGCAGLRRQSSRTRLAGTIGTLCSRITAGAWLMYVLMDGIVGTGMFGVSVWANTVFFTAFGAFSATLVALALIATAAMRDRTLPWWGTYPVVIVPPLGGVCLILFWKATTGVMATVWSPALDMVLYVTIGVSWLLLGFALLRSSVRESQTAAASDASLPPPPRLWGQ
jgi:hypothetical protein